VYQPNRSLPVDLHDDELVAVCIIDVNDLPYLFPNVEWKVLWALLRSDNLHGLSQLSFVNASRACLLFPTNVIKEIRVQGEVYWTRPR
jgi:hypothetical protein